MSSLKELISTGAVCRCLRSKTLFYQVPPEAEGNPAEPVGLGLIPQARDEEPLWCLHTQSLIGPDGKIAELDSCRPGRSCCETV